MKYLKRIDKESFPTEYSRHHLIPRSRICGVAKNNKGHTVKILSWKHALYHCIFSNMLPIETIRAVLNYYNYHIPLIQEEFNDICSLVKRKTYHRIYVEKKENIEFNNSEKSWIVSNFERENPTKLIEFLLFDIFNLVTVNGGSMIISRFLNTLNQISECKSVV